MSQEFPGRAWQWEYGTGNSTLVSRGEGSGADRRRHPGSWPSPLFPPVHGSLRRFWGWDDLDAALCSLSVGSHGSQPNPAVGQPGLPTPCPGSEIVISKPELQACRTKAISMEHLSKEPASLPLHAPCPHPSPGHRCPRSPDLCHSPFTPQHPRGEPRPLWQLCRLPSHGCGKSLPAAL